MNKKKLIIASLFTFIFTFSIVTIIQNTYALPTRNPNNGAQFLGGDDPEPTYMTCTVTFIGCDASRMQSRCSGFHSDATLNGNVCSWQMIDNGENSCGNSTETCSETPSEKCYVCINDSNTFYWGSSAPSSGTNGCSSGWSQVVSITDSASCVSKVPDPTPNSTVIIISKQDVTNKGKELPGATLVIKNSQGNEVTTWVTGNTTKVIEDLSVGVYTLEEVKAPDGYELNTQVISFEVTKDGKTVTKTLYNTPKQEIENPDTGSWLLYVAYLIGILALGYTGYYSYKAIKSREK